MPLAARRPDPRPRRSRWRPGSSTSPSTRCSRGRAAARRSRRSPTGGRWSRPASTCSTSARWRRKAGRRSRPRRRPRRWSRRSRGWPAVGRAGLRRHLLGRGRAAGARRGRGRDQRHLRRLRGDVRAGRRERLRLRADAHRGPAAGRSAAARLRRRRRPPEVLVRGASRAGARALGVAEEQIAIDPGLDFDLSTEQDLEILRRLGELRALGLPLYVSLSRKDFIGAVLAGSWEERLPAGRARVGDGRRRSPSRSRARRRHPPHPRPHLAAGDAGSPGAIRRGRPPERRLMAQEPARDARGRSRSTLPAATAASSPRAPRRSAARSRVALPRSLDPGLRRGAAAGRDRAPLLAPARGAGGGRRAPTWSITSGTASGKSLAFNLPVLDGDRPRPQAPRPLPLPDQGAGPGPGAQARPSCGRPDLREAIYDGDTPREERPGDPPPQQPRPHQPGHAPRRPPAQPQELGRLPRQPRLGRRRRGPHLPRRLRLPRRQRAAAAAAGRPRLRGRAALPARLGDDRQPGRAGRAAGRRRPSS